MKATIVWLINVLAFGGGNGAPMPPATALPGPATHAAQGAGTTLPGSGCEPAMACVALAVYTESTGEPLLGQIAVASVIRKRVYDRMMSPCEVISEKNQFEGITKYNRGSEPWAKDPTNWLISLMVAEMVFDYNVEVPGCEDSDYFFRPEVTQAWTRRVTRTCRVGDHIFAKN